MMNKLIPLVLLLLSLLGCKTTVLPEGALEKNTKIASLAYQRGDLHLAEGYLQRILDTNPNHSDSWCQLGNIRYRLHDYEAATRAYDRCLKLNPSQPVIWHNAAAVKLRQATELLLIGQGYLADNSAPVSSPLASQIQQLLVELMRLHGINSTTHGESDYDS